MHAVHRPSFFSRLGAVGAMLTIALLAGCGGDDAPPPAAPGGPGTPDTLAMMLKAFSSQQEFEKFVEASLESGMGPYRPGEEVAIDFGAPGALPQPDGSTISAPSDSKADSGGTGYSQTNVHEAGVDEPDRIKTDGQFLFVQSGRKVNIVALGDPRNLTLAAALDVPGEVNGLLLTANDKLVVFYHADAATVDGATTDKTLQFYMGVTGIMVVDVSDATTPAVERNLWLEGYYHAARRIDETLYVVINSGVYAPTPLVDTTTNADTSVDPQIPRYIEWNGNGDVVGSGTAVAITDIFHPERPRGMGLTLIAGLDLSTPDSQFKSKAYLGNASTVYASPSALYVVDTQWLGDVVDLPVGGAPGTGTAVSSPGVPSASPGVEATTTFRALENGPHSVIHKFNLAADEIVLAGSGHVTGNLLNQYSLSEFDGFLRVATHTAWGGGADLFVLELKSGELVEVGSIRDIEPDEQLYAARFVGAKGFLVTFERVDPLFTLDLRDPYAPHVVGELIVPGFSSYLHPVDDTHLIGLGRDVDASGDWALRQGIQLSVFDVSNFADPALLDKAVIGSRSTSSEAEYDATAFSYWPQERLLALPVTDWSGVDTFAPEKNVFHGIYVFQLDAQHNLAFVGTLSRAATDTTPSWMRSVFIGNQVYAVSDRDVTVAALSDVTTALGSLSFNVDTPGGVTPPPVIFATP